MGIFTKLSTVIKSNINDLISRAENPEKMLNQIIIDMRDQLAKAKREVAAAIADERKLKAQLETEVKQARDWQHRAMLAVKEGRDDLAKQALLRQQEHTERARSFSRRGRPRLARQRSSRARCANSTTKSKRRSGSGICWSQSRSARRLSGASTRRCRVSPIPRRSKPSTGWRTRSRRKSGRALLTRKSPPSWVVTRLRASFIRLEAGPGGADVEDQLLALKADMGLIAATGARRGAEATRSR